MSKDLFSDQSKLYAKYRPVYPQELFDYILNFVEHRQSAWDCATGNGQAARALADHFTQVEASDISRAQVAHAINKSNIRYHVCPAEQTPFEEDSFDLITVATAYHWLRWDKFQPEAKRVAKQNSVIAIWAYNLLCSDDPAINSLIHKFYHEIIAPYWHPERKHVENSYQTVSFDFDPLPSKDFSIYLTWTREQFYGYLKTWSGVQNYIKLMKADPLDDIKNEMDFAWKVDEVKVMQFPLFLKLGRIKK